VVTDVSSCLAQRHDFSVSGWIMIDKVAIPSLSNHAPLTHHDRSHRHVARLQRALGAAQGFFHPKFIRSRLVRRKFVSGGQFSFTSGWLPKARFRSRDSDPKARVLVLKRDRSSLTGEWLSWGVGTSVPISDAAGLVAPTRASGRQLAHLSDNSVHVLRLAAIICSKADSKPWHGTCI
jgi:hypothetical protein